MTTLCEASASLLPAFFHRHDFDALDSTNDEAKRRARAGAPEGTLIVARQQSSGRGRRGRTWQSPEGNLYCSLVLRPERRLTEAAQLSFVAAVALAETLTNWLPAERIGLKWPNDVLVDGAKISGILLESEVQSEGRADWIVVGVGVNLASCPVGLDRPAAALNDVAGTTITADALLAALALDFVAWYDRWVEQGFVPVRAAWLAHAAFLNEQIAVRLPEGDTGGIFEGLDADGSMLLRLEDGRQRQITVGEVTSPVG